MFEQPDLEALARALEEMSSGLADLPYAKTASLSDDDVAQLMDVARQMQDNYPYAHPMYAGQMLKPPHPIARFAYALAMWVNPNNHALDGGRASSRMEKEAVAELAHMVGWDVHLGHLAGGGTMANMEALWVAGRLSDGKTVVASEHAHYTHGRLCDVLKLPFDSVSADANARMSMDALKRLLDSGKIGCVVATLGTPGAGSVDPLHEIVALKETYPFRLHVDAAYGGYYKLADNLGVNAQSAFSLMHEADSIVIDPHKHGLQPYGCGCVLFRDPVVGGLYHHDSPYTYFTSDELHLGEISLECSRPGASAVALWATQRQYPLVVDGTFAKDLARCREAAIKLADRLQADARYMIALEPELDIVTWAPVAASTTEVSNKSKLLFAEAASRGLHLALATFPSEMFTERWPNVIATSETVTCLRSCLMKPEHLEWLDRIWSIVDEIAA